MQALLKLLVRVAIVAAAVLLVVGLTTVFIPKYRQMRGLEARCRVLRGQVDAKQRDIHRIKVNQSRLLTDPEFVARVAHQNRRMFPNEIVFVFDDR